MGLAGLVAHMERNRILYKVLVELKVQRPFGRTMHSWEGDIKMDLEGIAFEGEVDIAGS
jgi:monoamine oxidase